MHGEIKYLANSLLPAQTQIVRDYKTQLDTMATEILRLRKEKFEKDPGSEYWDADTCMSVA